MQFGVKKFEQIGSANGVDQHRAMFDRPPLSIHAIAIATDLKANHARTKRLEQHLGVGRVVAEIGDNESIGIVAAINRRERAGTGAAIEALRQLRKLPNSKQPRRDWTVAADDSGRTITTAPHIMRNDERLETGPSVGIIPIECSSSDSSACSETLEGIGDRHRPR